MPIERYWTPAEVAARLKVLPVTVRRWIQRGELKAVRLGSGRSLRVPESALEAFLSKDAKLRPAKYSRTAAHLVKLAKGKGKARAPRRRRRAKSG